MDDDDDEDEFFEGLYVDGHWEWDFEGEKLIFLSDAESKEDSLLEIIAGPIEFKDDIDLIEQQRFKKRFQGKSEGDSDVVTLQDVKDLVLFTAPASVLTPAVINILHLPATERFLRALILYSQYYVQISDEMSRRVLDLEMKIRTENSEHKERGFCENLQDLRLLIVKEYSTMILGGGDFHKHHHMGALKLQSFTRKDALLFESLIRISVQIVYIALGRKMHHIIELEVNRIFKSQMYNIVEHKRQTDTIAAMSPEERAVLIGNCNRRSSGPRVHSPLINEILCSNREFDYRILGLGVIKQHQLENRLLYMERALVTPENHLRNHNMNLGIIGLKRNSFDTMLREIKVMNNASTSSVKSASRVQAQRRASRMSNASRKSAATLAQLKLYPDISFPKRCEHAHTQLPVHFPSEIHPANEGGWCSNTQRKKWLARAARFYAARLASRSVKGGRYIK